MVLEDRSADGAAELIRAKRRFELAVQVREEVRRLEAIVPEVLEGRSMELVGTGLGNGVDYAAAGIAVLSTVVVGLDSHFLDRLDRGAVLRAIESGVVVVAAVEQEL